MITNLFNQYCCFLCIAAVFVSCTSNEIGQSNDVNQQTIYQFYRLECDENEKVASMYAQFRFAGKNGTTLYLNTPAGIKYNNTSLQSDSSFFSGAFYRAGIPLEKITGRHYLVYTDNDKKKYENDFSIDSFYLKDVPLTFSKRAPAKIQYQAPVLYGEDYISLESSGTDSGFIIMHRADKQENYITIPASQLSRQKINEIFVIPSLYRKHKLQQQSKEGGEIITIQTLKPVPIQLLDDAK